MDRVSETDLMESDPAALPRWKDLSPILGNHYRVSGLSGFERALLSTDGSTTILMEAFRKAPIDIVVLSNVARPASDEAAEQLDVEPGQTVWHREVLLVDQKSREPLIYACSVVNPSVLDADQQKSLEVSPLGLGRVLTSSKMDTRRELLGFAIERGGSHIGAFGLPLNASSVCKSYRIKTGDQTIALITEKLPRDLLRVGPVPEEPDADLYALGPKRIFLGLGSNLGDRQKHLIDAVTEMARQGITVDSYSAIYDTQPIGMRSDERFCNAAVSIIFEGSLDHLLSTLKEIERVLGRREAVKWTDRVIDIDILFAGKMQINSSRLQVPHPLALQRPFVMTPLVDIAPSFVDPESGMKLRALLEAQHGQAELFLKSLSAEEFRTAVQSRLEERSVEPRRKSGQFIYIKDLEVECIIGIYPHERVTPQRLYFDVQLEVDIVDAASTDDIDQTINYDLVAGLIETQCLTGKYRLVETCVARIRDKILERWPHVKSIDIKTKKPAAIANAAYTAVGIVEDQS